MAEEEDGEAVLPTTEPLPSERSMKFYDGTYRWTSDGFEDDLGGTKTLSRLIILHG
jgi:hypothetical protein